MITPTEQARNNIINNPTKHNPALGFLQVIYISLTLQRRPMTFLATDATFAEARATAVSAMISAWPDPNPPVTERLIKESSTMSISSDTWQNTVVE